MKDEEGKGQAAVKPKKLSAGHRSLLREVSHDLSSPLGTIGIELFCLEELTQDLEKAALARDYERLIEIVDEIKSSQQNLSAACLSAKQIVSCLQSRAKGA